MVGSEDVPLYRPKETYSERVTTFATKAQKARFEKLLKIWTALDQAADPDSKSWSEAEGMRRFMDSGLDGAFAEIGGEPATDAELARVIERLISEQKKRK